MEILFILFAIIIVVVVVIPTLSYDSNLQKEAETAGDKIHDRALKDYKEWIRDFERKYSGYLKKGFRYPLIMKKGFPNNQETIDSLDQIVEEANKNHWNALKKSNDKKDKTLKDWIASNARLWVDLDKQQQAEILAGGIAEAKKQWGSNPRYRR